MNRLLCQANNYGSQNKIIRFGMGQLYNRSFRSIGRRAQILIARLNLTLNEYLNRHYLGLDKLDV